MHAKNENGRTARSMSKKEPNYKVGDEDWLYATLFSDLSQSKVLEYIFMHKRFRPFKILELTGRDALRLVLLPPVKMHSVIHVKHRITAVSKLLDICAYSMVKHSDAPASSSENLIEFYRILRYKNVPSGYYCLTLEKGKQKHKKEWRPVSSFVSMLTGPVPRSSTELFSIFQNNLTSINRDVRGSGGLNSSQYLFRNICVIELLLIAN